MQCKGGTELPIEIRKVVLSVVTWDGKVMPQLQSGNMTLFVPTRR